jgi:ribonuclease T
MAGGAAQNPSCPVARRTRGPKRLSGFSLEDLHRTGLPPAEAMRRFRDWLKGLMDRDSVLVFVGFNAPFDWSFINYYFHKFLGENPFGFTALDIKAYYMGSTGCRWVNHITQTNL